MEFRDTDKSGLCVHDPGVKQSREKESDNPILFFLKTSHFFWEGEKLKMQLLRCWEGKQIVERPYLVEENKTE